LCLWVEKVQDQRPKNWGFYRMSTECNRQHVAADWYDQFVAAVPDEMKATRLTGALATFEGVIYPTFSIGTHVIRGPLDFYAAVGKHYRAVDWGAGAEHPFVCLWLWRSSAGEWIVYDEYWTNSQAPTLADHAKEIDTRSQDWGWPEAGERAPGFGEMIADPENAIACREFAAHGYEIRSARKTVNDGIDCVRSLLKVQPATNRPRLRIHERCKHVIDEMRKYRWDRRAKQAIGGRVIAVALPRPLKRDDDCVDAERYGVFTIESGEGLTLSSMSYQDWRQRHRHVQLSQADGDDGELEGMGGKMLSGAGNGNAHDRNGNGRHGRNGSVRHNDA